MTSTLESSRAIEASRVILPDTTLCVIARDEMMNPAGGIERFVDSQVPHFEKAIITDTGSRDGTWKKLQELAKKYPNLQVTQIPFKGYSESRNHGLKLVETEYVQVLDCDEMIAPRDFESLRRFLLENLSVPGFNFRFTEVKGEIEVCGVGFAGHNPRLFAKNGLLNYRGFKWECLRDERGVEVEYYESMMTSPVPIYHFKSPIRGEYEKKTREWYNLPDEKKKETAPSELPNFGVWKAFNPMRNDPRLN